MKKKIALLLTLTMTAVMLAGCGKTVEESQTGKGKDDNTLKESPEKEESKKDNQITLTVMCNGTEEMPVIAGYRKIAEKFSEDNEYGAEVKLELYENEQYKTKLTTLMAANSVTDIFFTWELSYLKPFVDGGKVADITSYLEADPQWKDSFAPGTLDLVSYDGKNYGIPTQKSLCVMYYNKKLFEGAGVQVPSTYDEFLKVCEALKDSGVIPMAMTGKEAWAPSQFIQQIAGGMAGDKLFKDICDGKEKWNNETHIKAAEEVKKMADAGYFPEGYIGMDTVEAKNLFISGKAAMYFMGNWDTAFIQESEMGKDAGVFVLPAYDPQYSNISVGSIDTTYAISENCKNKDAAIAFLKYWTSQENEEMLLYDYGYLPSGKFGIDESRLKPLAADIVNISANQVGMTPWWDRQFGAGEGVEFNNTCVAILGGEDVKSAFDNLQKFAEENADR